MKRTIELMLLQQLRNYISLMVTVLVSAIDYCCFLSFSVSREFVNWRLFF